MGVHWLQPDCLGGSLANGQGEVSGGRVGAGFRAQGLGFAGSLPMK
ncbi:hypothetical protein RR42_m0117 [Cupriavidus basilensis]|uniref:Uncharacterized protein n=1 Tax=Cupriavidus basilensis TaxID=68895 RepID=A0A0C4XYJ4_9BURK|nr:hypothetical protein RR42_m0117 [Cupriavidus basilensis]